MKETNKKAILMTIAVSVVTLIIGYILGALIGFGPNKGGAADWVGTYTTGVWNGHERVSLTLSKDGSCKLPKIYDIPCTYKVKDGYVYFNGQETSTTAIGETGLVYADTYFTKLK